MGGSKSGSAGTTYDYYGTIACGIAIGQIDDLVGIILDGQAVWPQGDTWPAGGAGFNVTTGQLYVFDAQTWVAQQNFAVPANPSNTDPTIPGNDSAYWVEYTFPRPGSFSPSTAQYNDFSIVTSDGTPYGDLRFYWGLSTQIVDPNLTAAGNDSGDLHPNYAGISYCIPIDFLLGQEVQSAPNIEIIVRRAPAQTVIAPSNGIVDGQCNLAEFMAEVLTNENGIGLPSASLDAVSFNAVATYLQTNEALYGASPLIDDTQTLREVCEQFTQMIDGYIRFNPSTGLIEMGVYQHGVAPALNTNGYGVAPNGAITLTEDQITERPQLKSTSWQGTYSRATVRYNDRQIDFQQTSLHADDPRAWAVLKSVRELSLDRPWITRAEQALLHGRETLRVVGHAQMTGTLTVRREIGRWIRGGDYVLLDVDIEPNVSTVYQFFRVTKRTIPPTGPIKLEVFADNSLAPIPASNTGAPVIGQSQAVPPVANFRFIEIPKILSGQSGAVAPLVQRPSDLVVGCQLNFDTTTGGTFPALGVFSGFAAKGVLYSNVATGDATVTVTVDTTQADADFFTQQFTATEQSDDTMLAFIVQVVSDPGQPDNGQIAENSSGYALVEICSVGATSLVAAGRYQLSVLRGRQNTSATAFNSANSEVWLIPRANVASFVSAVFPTLRANRQAGLTPAYGYFRLCPYTYVAQLPLASAANDPFRFPLNSPSAPSLVLTSPNAYSLNYANQAYPIIVNCAGTWSDPNGNIVEVKVLLTPAGAADRVIVDQNVAPTGSQAFNTNVQIDQAGNYTIRLICRDATNYVTEQDITVTVTGAGAQCAYPNVFDVDGAQVDTLAPHQAGGFGNPWVVPVLHMVPYGVLELSCSTPGATITFSAPVALVNGVITTNAFDLTYVAGQCQPLLMPIEEQEGSQQVWTVQTTYSFTVSASAPGLAPSETVTLNIPILMQA